MTINIKASINIDVGDQLNATVSINGKTDFNEMIKEIIPSASRTYNSSYESSLVSIESIDDSFQNFVMKGISFTVITKSGFRVEIDIDDQEFTDLISYSQAVTERLNTIYNKFEKAIAEHAFIVGVIELNGFKLGVE